MAKDFSKTTAEIVRGIFDNYIPSWWNREGTNEQIYEGFCGQISELTKNLQGMYLSQALDTAQGNDLDSFGLLFKLSRDNGEEDDSYRARIKAYFSSFSDGGTLEEMQNTLALMSGLAPESVIVTELMSFFKQQFIANMETGETWAGTGVTTDSTYYYEGSHSTRLTSTGAETITATLTRGFTNLDNVIPDADTFQYWVRFDDVTKILNFNLKFTDGSLNTATNTKLASEIIENPSLFLFSKTDFALSDPSFDWNDIDNVIIEIETSDITFASFDYIYFGTYDKNLKFDVDFTLDSSTPICVVSSVQDVINDTKAAGTYNRNLTFSSAEDMFLINLSDVNGPDKYL